MGGNRVIKLWFAAALVTCGLGILVASGPAMADTITVTNTNDACAGSLRQAIADEHHITVIELDTGEVLSTHLIEPDRAYWRNQNKKPGRWPSSPN